MSHLLVLTPTIGAPSETFVQRHVTELHRSTSVVARQLHVDPAWQVDHTLLGSRRRAPFTPIPTPDEVRAVSREMRRASSVLTEYLDEWWYAPILSYRARVPLFAHAHGYDVSRRLNSRAWRALYRTYRLATGIITVTNYGRRKLIAAGASAGSVHVVPCGVPVPDCETRATGERISVVSVGRLVPKKAPHLVVAAFASALDRAPSVSSHLTIVGDGPLRGKVEAAIREFKMENNVTLTGAVPNGSVLELLSRADVYLQHSVVDAAGDEEGLPVAILEAMARAVPVVATRHAGIPEAVVDGETGYLVEEHSVSDMGARLSRLLLDPVLRSDMGVAARARVCERFSWSVERASLRELLGLT